jgi:hypothetical protein
VEENVPSRPKFEVSQPLLKQAQGLNDGGLLERLHYIQNVGGIFEESLNLKI